jgi:hypothetical protein
LSVPTDVDRLLAIVCRELGARQAVVLELEGSPAADDARDLRSPLPGGRVLVARFDAPPTERDAKQRRLEMLASTFEAASGPEEAARPRARPPVAHSLRDELRTLCARAAAVNALIVDANSPVVWGAADSACLGGDWPIAGEPADDPAEAPAPQAPHGAACRAAIDAVRNLPGMAALRRGKHLRHVEREGTGPFLVHSFAGIYCLILVFEAPFDELRAERSVADVLARIEQLVLALPPLDPSPHAGAGVVAIRRPRRK